MPERELPKGEREGSGRSGARKALFSVVLAALCLTLIGIVLRVLSPADDSDLPSLEERVQALPPKAPGEYRVLALGGALPSSSGVETSWAQVLEARARADGRPLTLVSLAEPGSGLPHHKQTLALVESDVEPDLIVIELSLGDDVHAYTLALEPHGGEPAPERSRYADLLARKESARVPLALERLLEDVAASEAECARLKALCAFVLLPVGLQIDERYHERFAALGYETAPWMAQPTPLMAALRPALRAQGAVVLDVLPALQAASERELLLRGETRLSDEGQRVVGTHVYEALRDMAAFDAEAESPSEGSARDPRLEALLAGTLEEASEEERRLAQRILALRTLREELRALLTALPAQKAVAERIQAEVVALEGALPSAEVKRVLDEAAQRLEREGPAEGSLLARGPVIERELTRLLEKEPLAASDAELVRALKRELSREQNATAALGTGASVAFRALRTLEEMKLALPELRRLRRER